MKKKKLLSTGALLSMGLLMAACAGGGKEGVQPEASASTVQETETQTAGGETQSSGAEAAAGAETAEPETDAQLIKPLSETGAPVSETESQEGEEMPDSIRVYGQVKELTEDSVYIENQDEANPYSKIRLRITEDTLILDASEGTIKALEDIQEEETIYAYVSPVMTRSMPPISNAAMIFCDVAQDTAPPEYATLEEVTKGEDGSLSILTNREMVYHVNEETPIEHFQSDEPGTLEELTEGTKVLAWYEIVLQSYPGQTTPVRIVIME